MSREGFLSYRRYLWLRRSVLLLVIMSAIYIYDKPVGGASGGTLLGYTYGVIATAGILFLMWYGIRKRSYDAKRTTLKATLSAHVWLGFSLIFIVPLHSGFSFGYNVHTLAYILMVITILSGVWGVMMYGKIPLELRSQRGGGSVKDILEQIHNLSSDIDEMAGLSGTGTVKSDGFIQMVARVDVPFRASLRRALMRTSPSEIDRKEAASLLAKLPKEEQEDALALIGLANQKRNLISRVQDEARALTWIRLWLYLHLPVSIALMVALIIHIFSVFFYW